jgi:hypothetical protein
MNAFAKRKIKSIELVYIRLFMLMMPRDTAKQSCINLRRNEWKPSLLLLPFKNSTTIKILILKWRE